MNIFYDKFEQTVRRIHANIKNINTLSLTTVFAFSNFVQADTVTFTGTGYITTNIEVSATPDGNNLQ